MKITRTDSTTLDRLLVLIEAYQRFYHVKNIDPERNRRFFSQFIEPDAPGVQHLIWIDDEAVGFSTIYFCYSSAQASAYALLNDLYVEPEYRGRGCGRALIKHAAEVARAQGLGRLQWMTQSENAVAQGLYDTLGANKTQWCVYTLAV